MEVKLGGTKGQSDDIDGRMSENTMAKRKKHPMIYITLHRKLKFEQHDPR